MLKTTARRGFVMLALAAATTAAFAQKTATVAAPGQQALNWPTKPLRIIVGFPGGSTPDVLARTIGEPLSKAIGQPVIIENRVGAGGNIAADLVARATDDHTIGVMTNGNLTIAKLLNPAVPFDPLKAFQPLSLIGSAPLVLAAPADSPFNNVQEFFLAARNGGNKWSYGSPGVGTVGHIGMELLKTKTNMDPVHVPYPGNAQVIQALMTNQIQLSLLPPALAAAQIKAGKLKLVGVTSLNRSPLVPDYTSLNEGGVLGFQLEIWNAAAAPVSMPRPIAAKLSGLISEITRSPEVRAKLFQQGWQVAGTSAEGLANRVRSDTATLGGIIMMRGIKVE